MKKKKKLIDLVIEKNLAHNSQEATALIMSGNIIVNDHKIDKAGTLINTDATIRLKNSNKSKYVSRGGDKLLGALETFNINCKGKVCLDIGLSTGGFSDVLLQHGADYVFGVDVSYGLLNLKIRNHEKTIILEKTNARNLTNEQLEKAAEKQAKKKGLTNDISLVVMDVSFISVTKIIPQLLKLVKNHCEFVILIKPQFEAPKEWIGDGGIIRDENKIEQTLQLVKEKLMSHNELTFIESCPAPISGTKGNQEYFFKLSSSF